MYVLHVYIYIYTYIYIYVHAHTNHVRGSSARRTGGRSARACRRRGGPIVILIAINANSYYY